MLRYYAIAALIVAAVGSALFAHRLAMQGWKLHPDTRGARQPAPGNANEGFVTTPEPYFVGQGGWVLSALPGCFEQTSSIEGPSLALTFHVPPAPQRMPPGTTLRSGNCTVTVRAHDLWVWRGQDRLRVPPEARLFNAKDGLTLVYEHGGRTEVRVYRRAAP
jgi:hypothetical protein